MVGSTDTKTQRIFLKRCAKATSARAKLVQTIKSTLANATTRHKAHITR